MAWLSRNNYVATDRLLAAMLNSLANDDRNWGGDVNGGGYRLSNVVVTGAQTPWLSNINGAGYVLSNVSGIDIITPTAVAAKLNFTQANVVAWDIQIPASDTSLTFSQGGVEKVRITPSGFMGIGTGTPYQQLSLIGPNRSTPAAADHFSIGEQTNNPIYRLKIGYFLEDGYKSCIQNYDGGPRGVLALNPLGGNVGIGTTYPLSRLSVIPSSDGTTVATLNQITIGESTNNIGVRLSIGFGSIGGAWCGVLQAIPNANILLNPSGGNVGIGTTSPAVLLSLGESPTARKLAVYDSPFDFLGFGVGGAILRYDAGVNSSHVFYTQSNQERMRISGAGNVGIGHADPGYKLEIAGDVNITGSYRKNGTPIGGSVTDVFDVSASRSLGTVYQNTSGKAMMVAVTLNCTAASDTESAQAVIQTDATANPTREVASALNWSSTRAMAQTITFWVLPEHYYRIAEIQATVTLARWVEWT